jgi:signal transduction histidine kinase
MFKVLTPDVFQNANLFWVFVISTIVYFAVCFAGHFAAGTSKYEEHLLLLAVTQPELSLSRERVLDKKKSYLNNQWANFLHNKIQSKLLVLGLSNNLITFEREISDIIDVVEKQSYIIKSSHIIKSTSISESLEIIGQLWSNSITLSIDLTDGLLQQNFDPVTLVDLEEVLRELIANAVRHGGASKVHIEIGSMENGRINIKSTNNGSPYKPNKVGLGTQFLNEVSPNNWKIGNKDGQVIVNLILVENKVIS